MRIFLTIFLLINNFFLFAENLDLKTAESLLLQFNYGQKAGKAAVEVSHQLRVQKYADLFPSVDAIVNVQYKALPQSYLLVKQTLPLLPQWFKDKKVLEVSEDIATRNVTLDAQNLLNNLRKLYFKIQNLEKQKTLALESYALVDRFKKDSEQRYQNGFIPKTDRDRAVLQKLKLDQTLFEVNFQLESAYKQLLISVGGPERPLILKTDLLVGTRFLKTSEKELRSYMNDHLNENVAIAKLKSESASLQVDSHRYKFFPTVSAQAQFPFNTHSGDEGDPVYTASLTWNLFSGGMDVSEHRRLWAQKEQAQYSAQDTMLNFSTEIEDLLANLLSGRSDFVRQDEGLKMWGDIVASSQRRFERGNISSKDLSDDINSYLEFATTYYNTIYTLLSNISQFCFVLGRNDLFHELLK